MLKLVGVAAALFSAALPLAGTAQEAMSADVLLETQAALGYRLLTLAPPEQNLTLSPASLAGAFAALDVGASEETRANIAATLGFTPETGPAAIAALQKAGRELAALPPEGGPLRFANAVFFDDGAALKPATYDDLKAAGVHADTADLAVQPGIDKINGWVAERTGNLIPTLLPQPLPDAELVGVNALYFKDTWQYTFPAEATAPALFNLVGGATADVSLMHLSAELPVREDDRFVAVTLPFADGNFALTVITTKDTAAPLADFAPAASWLSGGGFEAREAELAMPKFAAEHAADLFDAAVALGLKPAMALPGFVDGPLTVGQILQKTVIKVDEQGAEAAAATAIIMERSIAMPGNGPIPVIVDKPFLFSLVDKSRGLVLLAGYVGKPEAGAPATEPAPTPAEPAAGAAPTPDGDPSSVVQGSASEAPPA